jgi:hypothetical protein
MAPPRFRIIPGDVPVEAAARRMGMTVEAFKAALPSLLSRGFPKADPTTGNYDLDAIDAWRRSRHSHLYGGREEFGARDAATVVASRLEALRGK